jgi:hypothetical protein
VKINLKRLHKVTSHGRTYYYAWRGGPRIEAEFGTKEFLDEYAHHNSPTAALDAVHISTWIAKFKGSPEYAGYAKSTKANWGPKLDNASKYFGKLSTRTFDKPQIRGEIKRWRDQWRDNPRTADMAKQALSRLCSFIIEEGHLSTNPCEGIANLYSNNRAEIIWLDEDFEALAKAAPKEIVWAARLGALTGLRQAACLELPWTRVGKHAIDMRRTASARGKGRGLIPIYADLRTLLDEIPKRATTVLTTTDGTPWATGFRSSWGKAMARSGLQAKGLHYHDLRGTAATKFYAAGFTSQEIADAMGWEKTAVETLLEIYVKRDELMLSRIRKMEQAGNTPVVKKEQA